MNNYISWLEQMDRVSSVSLTVRAQSLDPSDNGDLIWDTLLPRENVDSLDIGIITGRSMKFVSDRREFDAPGRQIQIVTPDVGQLSITPIEAYHLIGEKELTTLRLQTGGNQQVFREQLAAPIPARSDVLVMANYRRIEVDVHSVLATGNLTWRNPQLGHAGTVSYQFSATRYQTAGVAWTNVTAYDNFIAWYEDGLAAIGGAARGVMLSRKVRKMLQQSAPMGVNQKKLTRAQLEDQLSEDLGVDFAFFENDRTADIYGDAGVIATNTRLWPVGKILMIPTGALGSTAFAPITRAMDMAAAVPDAKIDMRGQAVFYLPYNDDKGLKLQAQINALPNPNEQKLWNIETGVT